MLPGEEERDKQSNDLIIGVDRTILVLHVHKHLSMGHGSGLTEKIMLVRDNSTK